jgi:NADPH-dependent 2,4-dienoyl-CoA reductase/sulfur reductase-like enzyme/rhodanese-related sulfurtransferase
MYAVGIRRRRSAVVKTMIIGGVAGGMAAAARLRRLDRDAEIVVIERGEHVSFANCGLPYYAGGEITDREELLLSSPADLRVRLGIEVRVRHEVVSIDPGARTVQVRDLRSGFEYRETYDHLVLSPGAAPIVPPLPGIERALTIRNVTDIDVVVAELAAGPRTAVVVGGGFIGVEMAENLQRRGLEVTVVELADQLLAPLDPELAQLVEDEMTANGVEVVLGDGLAEVTESEVVLSSGLRLAADVVILAIGVRPETALARQAGLSLGPRGGIAVDDQCRTSDPWVFAVGDAVEQADAVSGDATLVPLANLAARHGRRVADAIAGLPISRGRAQGTAVVRVFGLTAAVTGWNEKRTRAAGRAHLAVHTHSLSHAGYFPGATPLALKLVVDTDTGMILGAQAVGAEGADKRVDVLATAMAAGMPAPALADLELGYAPQYGSAKDPVNILGYVVEDRLRGADSLQWHELAAALDAGAMLIDVRSPEEHVQGHIPGAHLHPIDEHESWIHTLRDRPLVVYCAVGQRGHLAASLLRAAGREVANLDGGYATWHAGTATRVLAAKAPPLAV